MEILIINHYYYYYYYYYYVIVFLGAKYTCLIELTRSILCCIPLGSHMFFISFQVYNVNIADLASAKWSSTKSKKKNWNSVFVLFENICFFFYWRYLLQLIKELRQSVSRETIRDTRRKQSINQLQWLEQESLVRVVEIVECLPSEKLAWLSAKFATTAARRTISPECQHKLQKTISKQQHKKAHFIEEDTPAFCITDGKPGKRHRHTASECK